MHSTSSKAIHEEHGVRFTYEEPADITEQFGLLPTGDISRKGSKRGDGRRALTKKGPKNPKSKGRRKANVIESDEEMQSLEDDDSDDSKTSQSEEEEGTQAHTNLHQGTQEATSQPERSAGEQRVSPALSTPNRKCSTCCQQCGICLIPLPRTALHTMPDNG